MVYLTDLHVAVLTIQIFSFVISDCQVKYNVPKFTISLPKTRQSDDQPCIFIVRAFVPDVCWLRLNFKRFALTDTQPCLNQYLRIGEKRICGSINGIRDFSFTGNSSTIEYRGDGSNALEIDVEQIRCKYQAIAKGCDLTSSQKSTEIYSTNYPSPYPTPISCGYTIITDPKKICHVAIRFIDFEVPDSPGCVKGRLLIEGSSYCGRRTGLVVYKNATENFKFDFTEGSGRSEGGFMLRVDQIPCTTEESSLREVADYQVHPFPPSPQNLCCNRVYSKPYFLLTSPGFLESNEPVDYTCHYQIVQASPRICRLRIRFLHFLLGREDVYFGCTDGFLEIDGHQYCGCKEGHSFVTYLRGGHKELILRMNGSGHKGFIIEVTQEQCDEFAGQKGPEMATRSPEGEVEVFSTNSTLEKVRSRFLLPSDDSGCHQWWHPIWLNKVSAILKAIPNHCPAPPVPPNFQFPPGPPPILPPFTYPSNDVPPLPFPIPISPPAGFDAGTFSPEFPFSPFSPGNPRPNSLPPPLPIPSNSDSCNVGQPPNLSFPPVLPQRPTYPHFPASNCHLYHGLKGTIISPGYPWSYPPNLRCCYRIRQERGFCSLELAFLDYEVFWSPKCSKDYLLLDHRARYCGHSLQSSVSYLKFRDGWASIDFVSDSIFSGRGFRAVYRQIPCFSNFISRKTDSDNGKSVSPPEISTFLPETTTINSFDLNVTPV